MFLGTSGEKRGDWGLVARTETCAVCTLVTHQARTGTWTGRSQNVLCDRQELETSEGGRIRKTWRAHERVGSSSSNACGGSVRVDMDVSRRHV